MALLPGGDLAVCGRPCGSANGPVLSRWNGAGWMPMPVAVTWVGGTPAGWPDKQFFHQVVVFELDAGANILAVSSSNAVELLVGTF